MTNEAITTERIERALRETAKAIVLHGEWILPIPERLERELREAKHRDKMRDRVRRLAAD